MAWRRSALGAFVLLAVGCSSVSETDIGSVSAVGDLAEAKAAWQRAAIGNYLVNVTETGQPLDGCRWVTEVNGADLRSRWYSTSDNECGERDVSVPALHRELSDRMAELEASSGTLEVVWGETGVPISIECDLDATDGEELSLAIEFQEETNSTRDASVRAALTNAKTRWSKADIGSYRLEAAEDRNYWSRGCRWLTVVADDTATESFVDPASDGQYCSEDEWTVEQVYDRISRFADSVDQFSDPAFGEHTLDVVFSELGVPERDDFDLGNGADEESSLRLKFTS